MKPIYRLLPLLAFLVCGSFRANAQCDTSSLVHDSLQFFVGPRYAAGDALVNSMVRHNDTLYLGGQFGYIGRYTGPFVRLNAITGELQNPATWPKVEGFIRQAISDGSGGFVIVGTFSKVGDSVRKNLAHINAAGLVSSLKVTPDLVGGDIYTVLLHNGILYFGGSFSTINGQTRNDAAAINFTTGALTTWNPNPNASVVAMATDGTNIFMGGGFTAIGAATRNRVACVNTTSGGATAWNPNANGGVGCIFIKNDKVYIGGSFTTIGSTTRNFVAAIDRLTGAPISWDANAGQQVSAITVHGSRVYIGGSFHTMGSQTRNYVAAVDTLAGALTSWNPILNWPVRAFQATGSTLYLGGLFSEANATMRNGIAALDTATAALLSFHPITYNSAEILSLTLSGGYIYAAGAFNSMGGEYRNSLAAINIKTNQLLPWSPNLDNEVYAMKIDNGKLYLGGRFVLANGLSRWHAAAFDLSNYSLLSWNPLDPVKGPQTDDVRSIDIAGSYAYLAGKMDITSGAHKCVVRVDKVTGAIDTWSPVMYGTTGSMWGNAVKVNGSNVYLAGKFNNASSASAGLIRYDLTNNNIHYYNLSDEANSVQIAGNKLYVGGKFNTVGSTTRRKAAAFNLATNALLPWHPNVTTNNSTTTISAIEMVKDYAILAGTYTVVNNYSRNIAPVDTSGGTLLSAWRPQMSVTNAVVPFGDTIIVGGSFKSANNHGLFGLARFHINNTNTTSATVSTSVSPICESVLTQFDVTTPASAIQPYQWHKNGVDVGSNIPTHTYAPTNNDQLSCTLTLSPGGNNCFMTTKVTSAVYTVNATPSITPSISILASSNNICEGTADTFKATANITGGTYQWVVNGNNVGTNIDEHIYVPADNDVVECAITVPGTGCYTANASGSNTITMNVVSKTNPVISLAGPASAIQGAPVTINATVADAGSNYSIEWINNGTPIATTTIPSVTYTKAPGTDNIVANITPVGCYTNASSTAHVVNDVTGISNILAVRGIDIFPNPMGRHLKAKGLQQGDVVTIYSIAGRQLQNRWIVTQSQQGHSFDTDNLPAGLYIVEVTGNDNISKGTIQVRKL